LTNHENRYGLYSKNYLPPVLLKNTEGKNFEEISENYTQFFIYFGYMKCSSLCPISLGVMKQLSDMIQDDKLGFFFINLDGRDSTEKLKLFNSNFDSRFHVLIGSEKDLKETSKNYNIQFTSDLTQMHHTGHLYFFNKIKSELLLYPSNYRDVLKIKKDIKNE
jgi:cytochrome oxidase Cu insertion factor (SCO1/SenC/PrrC family)